MIAVYETATGAVLRVVSSDGGDLPSGQASLELNADADAEALAQSGAALVVVAGELKAPEMIRKRRAADVAAKREAVMSTGYATPAGTVATDIDTRLLVLGAVVTAQLVFNGQGPTAFAAWSYAIPLVGGGTVDLNGPDIITLGLAMGSMATSANNRLAALLAEINDPEKSPAEVEAIDIETGWPA